MSEGRDAEVAENLGRYPDDIAADWAYTRALLTFRAEGDTAKSRQELQSAFECNPHVPAYLLGSRPMPEHLPEYIGIGDENEAVDYVLGAMAVWRETPGALPWLVMNRGKRDLDLTGAGPTGIKSRTEQFKIGDSVALKAGQRLEVTNIDVSGWQGWIEDIYEDGDLWLRWDSQSLEAFPDEAIRRMFEELMDWTSLVVEPQFVVAAAPRDKPTDGLAVATKRMEALGLDPDELLYDFDPDWFDDDDVDWAGPSGHPDYAPFDLDSFIAEAQITRRSEQNAIRGALKAGLGNYYNDLFGYYRYGRRPDAIERMGVPQIFGYGAIEILDRKSIGSPTKLKIVRYAIDIMEPAQEQGVPYGMISLLGFAALEGALRDAEFNLGMLGLQYSRMMPFARPIWLEAVTKDRLIALADWLASHEQMPDEEKLWWIWQLGRHSEEQPHLGRALLDHWLGRPDVADGSKAEVCWGWLDDKREVGQAPLLWLLGDAYLMGDRERFRQLLEEADVDVESLPLPFDDEEDSAEDEPEFPFDVFRSLRHFVFMPPSLKRGSIPGLVRYSGEGFEEIAEQFWDLKGSYYIDAINSGIADAIEEFQESIPPERVRFWIERGINYSRAQTRKRFYALSIEFYGTEYLEKAVYDNAKSVRTWARKKLRAMGGR